MSDAVLEPAAKSDLRPAPPRLEDVLVARGDLSPFDRRRVRALAARLGCPVAQVLRAEGHVAADRLLDAQAEQTDTLCLAPGSMPDPDLGDLLPPGFCRAHGLLPWRRDGETILLATAHPETFEALRPRLPRAWRDRAIPAPALEETVQSLIAERHGIRFRDAAAACVPEDESCRDFLRPCRRPMHAASVACLAAAALLLLRPDLVLAALTFWALLTLACASALKAAALVAALRRPLRTRRRRPLPARAGPPTISVIVPLYRETEIAHALLDRLDRLTYPRPLLQVLLALEESDHQTRALLATTPLPPWISVVEVPDGAPRTKPRALNYALGACRGEIVGVWDAEDAPDPDQLERVAEALHTAPPDVACVQGALDHYNPRDGWLARCFTLEYAAWFRVLLPGMVRMGLAIPLGGTTVFFRRRALERLRGWDAHNVTEDADLGVRLARHGYRAAMLDSTTREEATARTWPWVRQRSRWLKGYMVTYLVHMRRPRRLRRQLGARRFWGMQALFLTTISQVLLAPLLWSFWLVPLGLPHPLAPWLGPAGAWALSLSLLGGLVIDQVSALIGLRRTGHRGLWGWSPLLPLYFPLATLAAYKGLAELVLAPFYWDKTRHGVTEAA